MMDEATMKKAEEIAELREQQGMTFKAIGEQYQMTPGRASYLYQAFLRRRRIARIRELYEQQNQTVVSVKMTLGEAVVLQRILSRYQTWVRRETSRRSREGNPLLQEPDYVTAEYLSERLASLERENRKGVQKTDIYPPKPIDFSTSN